MRIVVKIGTSTLAHPGGRLNIRNVEELVKVLSDIKNAGHEIILVSSGAIGMGIGKLNMDRHIWMCRQNRRQQLLVNANSCILMIRCSSSTVTP